jgi:UDP-N-acetylglucosamine 2-epimerase (non-hydrolysing)
MTTELTVLHVVGARPNFMKAAPLLAELESRQGVRNVLVHTGQHYDHQMSRSFFQDLEIRAPDHNLGVGSGSHAVQTATVMMRIEPVLMEADPDVVVVVGDVNSTVAAALTAAKLGIPVAHVEAGLRSDDRTMPEELNRIVTDQLSDLLLTPSPDANDRLRTEGISEEKIHLVGNIMVDSLFRQLDRARSLDMPGRLRLGPKNYVLATLHRPSNVDHPDQLREIFLALDEIAGQWPVIFPMHPRTRANAERFGLRPERASVVAPLGYLEMIGLMDQATAVLTDSGGIQEETTAMGIPCLTLRSSTERPITLTEGTNHLVPLRTREQILRVFEEAVDTPTEGRCPALWDGKAAGRIGDVLEEWSRQRTDGPEPIGQAGAGHVVVGAPGSGQARRDEGARRDTLATLGGVEGD